MTFLWTLKVIISREVTLPTLLSGHLFWKTSIFCHLFNRISSFTPSRTPHLSQYVLSHSSIAPQLKVFWTFWFSPVTSWRGSQTWPICPGIPTSRLNHLGMKTVVADSLLEVQLPNEPWCPSVGWSALGPFRLGSRVSIRAQNWSANNCSHFRSECERIVRTFALLFVLFWRTNKSKQRKDGQTWRTDLTERHVGQIRRTDVTDGSDGRTWRTEVL